MRSHQNSNLGLRWVLAWIVVMLSAASVAPSKAQEAPATQRVMDVGVYTSPPFVMQESGHYSGMAIELWERVASRLSVVSTYREFGTYAELLDAVTNGTVEVAVTNLTITEDRVQRVDFTYPWFNSGLRVMVRSNAGSSFSDIVADLRDAGHLVAYGWLALAILVATGAMTLFDRRYDPEFPTRWLDGVAESLYHITSLATSGQASHRNLFGWIGRILQAMWMIVGVALVAYVTASVTSVMTASYVSNQINSVADLEGKRVGVRAGSIAEQYVRGGFAIAKPFGHLDEALRDLMNGEVDAIVGDKPVLEYASFSRPDLPIKVVGGTFHADKYGFALTFGNALTRQASVAIISLEESGEIEKLEAKYFGPRK